MSEEEEEICEPDDPCEIDPSSIEGSSDSTGGVLIVVLKGSYLTWDHADSAVEFGKAVLSIGERVTMYLKGDAVLMAKEGQGGGEHGSLGGKLLEVTEFGGNVLVSGESLKARGLRIDETLSGVEAVDEGRLYSEAMSHDQVLTF